MGRACAADSSAVVAFFFVGGAFFDFAILQAPAVRKVSRRTLQFVGRNDEAVACCLQSIAINVAVHFTS